MPAPAGADEPDVTPPRTTITAAAGTFTFTFTASEDGVTFTCALDDAEPAPCTSPYTPPALAPGEHVLRVVATDAAGNAEAEPATHAFTVAAPAPPPAPPVPAPAPAPPAPPAPTFVVGFDEYKTAPGPGVTLLTRTARPDRRGRVRLVVHCRSACRGTLAVGRARHAYRAGPGGRTTVTVTLDAPTRARLRRATTRITVTAALAGTRAALTITKR